MTPFVRNTARLYVAEVVICAVALYGLYRGWIRRAYGG
jgi:hypothetical protein